MGIERVKQEFRNLPQLIRFPLKALVILHVSLKCLSQFQISQIQEISECLQLFLDWNPFSLAAIEDTEFALFIYEKFHVSNFVSKLSVDVTGEASQSTGLQKINLSCKRS